jgi:hypothetical protein
MYSVSVALVTVLPAGIVERSKLRSARRSSPESTVPQNIPGPAPLLGVPAAVW